MKNKIVNTINFFKNNSRNRALLTLSLYIIFFAIVFAIFGGSSSNQNYNNIDNKPDDSTNIVDVLEKYKKLNKYSFIIDVNYVIGSEVVRYTLDGEVKDKDIYFIDSENNQYYFTNNLLFLDGEDVLEERDNPIVKEVLKYQPSFVYDLIKQAELQFKIDNIAEKTVEKIYKLDIRKINGYEYNDELYMLVTTIENEEKIKNVTISFENLEEEKVSFNDITKIIINYPVES